MYETYRGYHFQIPDISEILQTAWSRVGESRRLSPRSVRDIHLIIIVNTKVCMDVFVNQWDEWTFVTLSNKTTEIIVMQLSMCVAG